MMLSAIVLPVLLGFSGLAVDVGLVMVQRTKQQRAADAAALAGAQALLFTSGDTAAKEAAAKTAACKFAEKNGYGSGTCPSDEVEVYLPPTSGAHKGDSSYVEVKITRTIPTVFMQVLGIEEKTTGARAVGATTPAKRNYALIVLNPTQCDAFSTSSNITINGGGAIVDSAATTGGNCIGESAVQNGGSVVTAQVCKDKDGNVIQCYLDYNTKGSWTVPNNSTASPAPTKAPYFPDPLTCGPPPGSQAHVNEDYCPRPVPCSNSSGTTPAGCVPWSTTSAGSGNKANNPTITQLTGAGEVTLEPGTYFGGIRINSDSQTVRFKPGIYVIAGSDHNGNGGGFDYQSGKLCGVGPVGTCPVATGVTFFNTDNPYANQAGNRPCNSINLVGNGLLKFAAPTVKHTTPLTGYLNMLIWQDDDCTAQFKFAGTGSGPWTATGLMYLPKAHMQVTGGGDFGAVQIIVDTFNQGGGQEIEIEFTRYIDTDASRYKLVE
jgi:Flp pilus assembly protein TadG